MANEKAGLKARGPWWGWLSRLFTRNSTTTMSTEQLVDHFRGFFQSKSGAPVTLETALQATAVLACLRVISEDVAAVPFVVKRRDGPGKPWRADEDHWLTRLMRAPNEWQTEFEFRQMVTAHAALAGDGYAFISVPFGSRPRELLPFPPGSVCPEWILPDRTDFHYRVTWRDGTHEIIPRKSMFRLRGMVWDVMLASEPFRLAREAIGIALSTEESHAEMHRNGVRLSGVLSQPPGTSPLTDPAVERISKRWLANFGPGANQRYGVAVLEGGLKFEKMSMSGVDAQHLETRAFQVEEVCRVMRVYPQMIGHYSKANTFGSSEQMFLAHDTHTVLPWSIKWGQRTERDFLPRSSEPNTWASYDVRGLRRGDSGSRASYYNSGIHAGWLNRNEARDMEGLEAREGLDEFLEPTQLAPGDSSDATNMRRQQSNEDEAQ